MSSKTIYIFFLSVFLFVSCNDSDIMDCDREPAEAIVPVEIEVTVKDFPGVRSLTDKSKKAFTVGELIHIRAVYKMKETDPEGKNNEIVQYAVMKYNGKGTWINLNTTDVLSWPNTAESATFEAYYFYGSTGVLSSQHMQPKLLSEYKFGEDPLYAITKEVMYGHTVRFEMEHIFTYLTLSEMSTGIPDILYFTIPEREEDYEEFNNAFRIEFDENTKEIKPVFLRTESEDFKDSDGNGLVYIEGQTELYDTNEGIVSARVSYFLQPKVYHKFDLIYPFTMQETVTYLSYTNNLAEITGPDGLLANNFYDFNIKKSQGMVVETDPEDSWDEKSAPYYILDVEQFLRAVNSGTDYAEDDQANPGEKVDILESTTDGCRLLRNIDFHQEYYDIFGNDNFTPDLSLTFDGDYHYIYNMAVPLFNNNNGVITNLGIADAKTKENQPIESNFRHRGGEFNRNGIIARSNIGRISNLRVKNVDMTVTIKTSGSSDDESIGESHSVALLIGSNRGNLYDVELAGEFKLTVKNADNIDVMPTVAIGGIAGQNLGTISGISAIEGEGFDSPEYTLTNECKGEQGSYFIGGIAGSTTGNIYNAVMSSINIDSSASRGVVSCLGGIVGTLSVSNAGAPEIAGCIVRGELTSGLTVPVTNIISYSYAGGVAGSLNVQGIIMNCSASIGVIGDKSSNYYSQVTYATGGAFGRIEQTAGANEGSVQTLACFGSQLSGLVNVGNFAGMAPQGFTWEDHYRDNKINVKQYQEYQYIGTFR